MKISKIRKTALLLAAVSCVPLASCGKNSGGKTAQAVDLTDQIQPQQVSGTVTDESFRAAQTAFALNLMQKTVQENQGNVLISPYSVMQALAMAANGANGETLTQMEQALGGIPIEELNKYLLSQRESQPNTNQCKLLNANSIWFRDDKNAIEVKQDFLQTNKNYYGANVYKEPFNQETVNHINRWCSDHTDKMIPKLLNEISGDSVMYLINAVLFDAKWESPYREEPAEYEFQAVDGSTQKAKMMLSDEFTYLSDDHAAGFVKPYADGKYAFAALLPEKGMSVQDYIAGLTPESLQHTLNHPEICSVSTGLPQFSYDFDTEMSDSLKAMGMQQAFTDNADLSRIGTAPDGNLCLGKVLHKTHIAVDTNGTKAAAVTAVEVNSCAAAEDTKHVFLNRPFLYMILDTETNLPVFMGTLAEIPQ